MPVWSMLQTLFYLGISLTVCILWFKIKNKMSRDDERIGKSLALLQSKIAVFEDLSDEVERKLRHMTVVLEQKAMDVQNKIRSADEQIHRIEQATEKSLQVAEIFQDRIPHEQIIHRQSTMRY